MAPMLWGGMDHFPVAAPAPSSATSSSQRQVQKLAPSLPHISHSTSPAKSAERFDEMVQLLLDRTLVPADLTNKKTIIQHPIKVYGTDMEFYYHQVVDAVDDEGKPQDNSSPESEHLKWQISKERIFHAIYDHATGECGYWLNDELTDIRHERPAVLISDLQLAMSNFATGRRI